MAVTHFSPAPGRFGEQYATPVLQGITSLTSAGVTTLLAPAHFRLAYFKRLTMVMGTVAAGTGALTVAVIKNRSGGGTVVLTPELSMFGRTAGLAFAADLASGVVDGDATIREGESLSLRFTNSGGTITTQPLQCHATLELAVLR
jgi:hypothetical protein